MIVDQNGCGRTRREFVTQNYYNPGGQHLLILAGCKSLVLCRHRVSVFLPGIVRLFRTPPIGLYHDMVLGYEQAAAPNTKA